MAGYDLNVIVVANELVLGEADELKSVVLSRFAAPFPPGDPGVVTCAYHRDVGPAFGNQRETRMEPEMASKITTTDNGPYMVEAETSLFDKNGNAVDTNGTYFLCRCGASQTKPFCDGSHKTNGFTA